MTNSPGWASPGPAPSDQRPDDGDPAAVGEVPDTTGGSTTGGSPAAVGGAPDATGGRSGPTGEGPVAAGEGSVAAGEGSVAAGGGQEKTPPQDAIPANWARKQPPPHGEQWGASPPPAPTGAGAEGGAFGAGLNGARGGWEPAGGAGWGRGPAAGPGSTGGGAPDWRALPLPPAPKPGVIPLRPLRLGEILEGALATLRLYARTTLSLSLAVALLAETASTLVTGLVFDDSTAALDRVGNDPNASVGTLLHALGEATAGDAAGLAIGGLGQLLATAMLTVVVSRAVLGRPVTVREAWRDARPRLPRLVGLTFVLMLCAVGVVAVGLAPGILVALYGSQNAGMALTVPGGFAGFCAAVWLLVRFSLAAPALMLEKQGVFAAMARSAKLVRGAWARVLGAESLGTLLALLASSLVQMPFSIVAAAVAGPQAASVTADGAAALTGWPSLAVLGLGAVLGAALTFPLTAGVSALLYMDQRIRRESLDIELARAAGV